MLLPWSTEIDVLTKLVGSMCGGSSIGFLVLSFRGKRIDIRSLTSNISVDNDGNLWKSL
jgi:hypothetical protein